MEQDDRQHYFIKYNGDSWKHFVVRPDKVEITMDSETNIDGVHDYRNTYTFETMTVYIEKQPNVRIVIENVTEIWIFPLYGNGSYTRTERPSIHPDAQGDYNIW